MNQARLSILHLQGVYVMEEGWQTREEPLVIENREFVGYEEEDIQRLNRIEAEKFENNPHLKQVLDSIEDELANSRHWEEHWLTLDASGRRVYARIYYGDNKAIAVTAKGEVVKEINYD